jgi:excisionase family DNA binding protein
MPGKELLKPDEAAAKLQITKRTLLRWARENRIESVKLSRKVVLFTAEAIDDLLKSKAKTVEPAPMNHRRAGRMIASPETRKGGIALSSRESWRSLRQEVASCQ